MINIETLKQAITLTKEGKYKEAEEIYTQLLEENPNESALLSTVGLFYVNLHNYDKAVKFLKKACEIKETIGTVSAYGFAEYERKNYNMAAQVLEKALTFGENIDIYNKLILSYFELKNFKKAIELTEKMNELYPNNPKTVANKIKSLTQQGKLLEAEKECIEYLQKNPINSTLWYHLGLLKELIYSDDIRAIECYKVAGEQGNLNSDYNIGVAYQKLGEYQKAEEHYKKFLEIFPNDEVGITSLGMCYLSQKNFKEGYNLFYKRTTGKAEKYTNNLWKQNSPLDKKLVIICDQGFGDHIQFIRYIPFLKEHDIKVAVGNPLKKLFEQNYPNIEFIDYNEINPETQALRVTDLAYVLNMDFDNIPFSKGYLEINPADIKNNKLKVGLCWEAGSAGVRGMINRTIHIKCFEPLFNLENVQIYSFQVSDTFNGNEKYSDKMINLAKDFKDFSNTAQALKSMDIVVTVDTCVAHLAGALGVKTYLLIPYAPDWRWFDCTKTTPWYNSIEIFKQANSISWDNEINNIVEKLESMQKS